MKATITLQEGDFDYAPFSIEGPELDRVWSKLLDQLQGQFAPKPTLIIIKIDYEHQVGATPVRCIRCDSLNTNSVGTIRHYCQDCHHFFTEKLA